MTVNILYPVNSLCYESGAYRADCPPRHIRNFTTGDRFTLCRICKGAVLWTRFAD